MLLACFGSERLTLFELRNAPATGGTSIQRGEVHSKCPSSTDALSRRRQHHAIAPYLRSQKAALPLPQRLGHHACAQVMQDNSQIYTHPPQR